MESITPTPGAPETARVRAMFDRIAPGYDLLNRVLSAGMDRRWRRRAVDALELRGPSRVLDLGTGTGDLLVEVLRRDRRHRGVGVDLSLGMLRRSIGKLRVRNLEGRARIVAGDAAQLPIRDGTFDAALAGFGVRNIGDPAAALRHLHRVLRPGGRLVVLEFSRLRGPFRLACGLYVRAVLPHIAGLWSERAAYSYLPASMAQFPAPEAFAALMEAAGFSGVRWRPLTAGLVCVHQGDKPT